MKITVTTPEAYDSAEDTKKHIAEVVNYGKKLCERWKRRWRSLSTRCLMCWARKTARRLLSVAANTVLTCVMRTIS